MLDAFWDPKITTIEGSFSFPWEKILRLVEPLSRAVRRCGFWAADWRRMVWWRDDIGCCFTPLFSQMEGKWMVYHLRSWWISVYFFLGRGLFRGGGGGFWCFFFFFFFIPLSVAERSSLFVWWTSGSRPSSRGRCRRGRRRRSGLNFWWWC